jgi:hypothetical protein
MLAYFWAVFATHATYLPWLVAHGLTGTPLHTLVLAFDSALNIALCLPAAFALCALRPPKLWLYLVTAVVPGLAWQYRLVISEASFFASNWAIFVPGFVSACLMLPVAVVIARALLSRHHRSQEGAPWPST